ncbi:MAG: hypothetical protein ACO1SV_24205 [Fimbriimonas sp.]
MNVPRLAIALFAASLMFGCAGNSPCGGADYGNSNPVYAGTYAGTYHNERVVNGSAAPEDLTLEVVVDGGGQITGTATEIESGRIAEVTGEITDWYAPCDKDKTFASLTLTFPEEDARHLEGSRRQGQAQPWPFETTYADGPVQVGSGDLVLTKQ